MNSKKVFQVTTVVLVIICAVLGHAIIDESNRLTNTQNALASTQANLSTTWSNWINTEEALASTQAKLTNTLTQLTTTQVQLNQTQSDLEVSKDQLEDTQNTLVNTQGQLTSIQSQLTDANIKLSAITGLPSPIIQVGVYFEGYEMVDADYRSIVLIGNPDAVNPTWEQLKSFLLSDNTYRQRYTEPEFVCANFAEMLYYHAEKSGIRSGYVCIDFGYLCSVNSEFGCPITCGGYHSCNVFDTTDRGLVFIDSTGTEDGSGEPTTVNVVTGQTYKPVSIFSNTSWCPMGTVYSFSITWQ